MGTGIVGPALNASRLLQKTRSSLRIAQYLCRKNAMSRVEVTCTRASARAPPLAATIVVRPSVRAVTTPESETLATAGAELLQVIGAPATTLSRASYTTAANETRRPSEKVDSAGVIVRRAAGLPAGSLASLQATVATTTAVMRIERSTAGSGSHARIEPDPRRNTLKRHKLAEESERCLGVEARVDPDRVAPFREPRCRDRDDQRRVPAQEHRPSGVAAARAALAALAV